MSEDIRERDRKTIGIDLGDRQSDLCMLSGSGAVVARTKAATTKPGLAKALKRYAGATVIVEVGTHSPWVSRYLEGLGHEVVVANAARVRRIAEMEDKSDRIDAELLARLGRADTKILRPIKHRGEQVQRDRALLRVRDELVRTRSSLVTQRGGSRSRWANDCRDATRRISRSGWIETSCAICFRDSGRSSQRWGSSAGRSRRWTGRSRR